MPYIGTQPLTGQFKKLDAISVVNGQAAYTLNYNSAAYKPATANALLVSVNGVIQAAGDAYTISGSTITFTENLVTGDVIDFIIALGDTGSAVTPVDGSVTKAKMGTTELDLATIKDSTGTNTAITIDSSGRVLKSVIPAWRLKCTETSYTSSGLKDLPIDTTVDADLTTDNARFITGGVTVSGNVVTVPVTGFYQINTVLRVDNIGSGYVEIRQRVNDTAANSLNIAVQAPSATYEKLVLTEVQYLQANDEIHYYVQVSNDTSWEIEDNSVISGILIG